MIRRLPPHLIPERTRHGKRVYYVRRWHGPRIRIWAEYDTPEFWEEYHAALKGHPARRGRAKGTPGTLRWGIDLYRAGSAWAGLAAATRRQRENIFIAVVAKSGAEKLADIKQSDIRRGRGKRADRPHAANNFLKAMRGLFKWAMEEALVTADPTKGVSILKGRNDKLGFHTWTEEELARFEARWPVGTRERLAYDILLYTGLRRGDAVRLGRQHVRDGEIVFRSTEKTGVDIVIPLLEPLARSIEATKTGDLAFVVTAAGRPWVKESFGNWFREACQAAGCPGSAHGLRKAGATRCATHGATVNQLMAMYGWTTPKMALHYTREADRRRLAADAAHLLLPAQSENESARTLASGAGEKSKTRANRKA